MAKAFSVRERKLVIENILSSSVKSPSLFREVLSLAIDQLKDPQLQVLNEDVQPLLNKDVSKPSTILS